MRGFGGTAKKGLLVGIGQLGTQLSSFVRHAIVARWLTPAEFGIAALFVTALQLVDLVSNAGVETFLVQDSEGDREDVQASVQWWRAMRGCMNGAAIFLLAGPMAYLFALPGLEWEIRLLGLFPLIRGFLHMDAKRLQRHMRFWPSVLMDAGSNVLATAVGIAVAWLTRDHRAMVAAMLALAAGSVLISHMVAERPYRWKADRSHVRRMMQFGWPLMVNGLLLFGIFQGDRLLIGMAKTVFGNDRFTLSELGVYSIVFSLTMAPALAGANIGTSLFLPMLSAVQKAPEEFARKYAMCLRWTAWAGMALAAVFLTAGTWLVVLVSGKQYQPNWWLVAWLSLLWSLRVVRVAPTMASLALGDTKNTLYSNVARSLALAGIAVVVTLRADVVWIAFCGFAGEMLALAVCFLGLRWTQALSLAEPARVMAWYTAGIVGFAAVGGTLGFSPLLGIATLAILAVSALLLPGVKHGLSDFWLRAARGAERR